ncbi:disulfide bond formation protein B, partial [Halobacteriales archaeon SW_12_67_38]
VPNLSLIAFVLVSLTLVAAVRRR